MNWDEYKGYFKKEEFDCKCGCGTNNMNPEVMVMLFNARTYANMPFKINSGARCETHNKKEGGSATSSHLKGVAIDIGIKNSFERHQIFINLRNAGFKRFGIGKNFIHVDFDLDKVQNVMWDYYEKN